MNKLSVKDIKDVEFHIIRYGYSSEEVDNFLDKIIKDYEKIGNNKNVITISKEFNGALYADTFVYEGTIQEWEKLDKDEFFKRIPCIKCVDGDLIQNL